MRQLLRVLPVQYIGISNSVRPPTPACEISYEYVGICWEVNHFVLFGVVEGKNFLLDSKYLQETDCCGAYAGLFAFLICMDIDHAEATFVRLRNFCGTREERLINDMVVCEALSEYINDQVLA